MKFFVLFGFLFSSCMALTPEQLSKLRSMPCQGQSGISDQEVQALDRGEMVDGSVVKKHLLCVAKVAGLMDDSGNVVEDLLATRIREAVDTDEKASDIKRECVHLSKAPEDTAYDIAKCILAFAPNFSPV